MKKLHEYRFGHIISVMTDRLNKWLGKVAELGEDDEKRKQVVQEGHDAMKKVRRALTQDEADAAYKLAQDKLRQLKSARQRLASEKEILDGLSE